MSHSDADSLPEPETLRMTWTCIIPSCTKIIRPGQKAFRLGFSRFCCGAHTRTEMRAFKAQIEAELMDATSQIVQPTQPLPKPRKRIWADDAGAVQKPPTDNHPRYVPQGDQKGT